MATAARTHSILRSPVRLARLIPAPLAVVHAGQLSAGA